MYHKSGQGGRSDPTPAQGVKSIKSVPTAPPKQMTQAVIQRLREATRDSTQNKSPK